MLSLSSALLLLALQEQQAPDAPQPNHGAAVPASAPAHARPRRP